MGSVSKKRELNFELLRVISMLLIILHHFVVHSNQNWSSLKLLGWNHFVVSFFAAGGKYGVVLFSMITGYFMISSRIRIKKILKLDLQVLFYSISIFCLFILFGRVQVTERELLQFLFPTFMKTYWFFSSYFFLYLMIPILNLMILHIKKKYFLGILGILFLFLILMLSVMVSWMGVFLLECICFMIILWFENGCGKRYFRFIIG